MDWNKLLTPGVNIKRWLLLLLIGVIFFGVGSALLLLVQIQQGESLVWYVTLGFLAEPLRALALLLLGGLFAALSLYQLSKTLLPLLFHQSADASLVGLVYEREALSSRPKVVIFGSGIGLLIFLNSIKNLVSNVTVVLPMGEDVQLYRELLSANQLTLRSVYATTIPNATLSAEFNDGFVLEGFLAIKESHRPGAINRLFLRSKNGDLPTNVPENAEIIQAIAAADAVIFGPASLFVGIVPSLLAKDITDAIRRSHAAKIFVCNVMTEPGKTDGYSVTKHVSVLEQHGQFDLDYIILNNKRVAFDLARKYHDSGADQVLLDFDEFENSHIKVNLAHRSGEVRMLNRAILIEEDLINAAFQRVLESGTTPRYEQESKLVVRHDTEKMRAVFERVFDLMAQRRA
jgi:uncharacterized cofD-like protein